ncbi:hypothetical protein F7725_024732 [Dissostichus mawsoni]|uniref:Uncharacterized protein n=1 Tax=Dissostichus mawsoni TaxID=36200 RepID=A0A7J5XAU0_DISMA|nr:hypothetical protein F7725_024732 [Dissostichus mawsoni]
MSLDNAQIHILLHIFLSRIHLDVESESNQLPFSESLKSSLSGGAAISIRLQLFRASSSLAQQAQQKQDIPSRPVRSLHRIERET